MVVRLQGCDETMNACCGVLKLFVFELFVVLRVSNYQCGFADVNTNVTNKYCRFNIKSTEDPEKN